MFEDLKPETPQTPLPRPEAEAPENAPVFVPMPETVPLPPEAHTPPAADTGFEPSEALVDEELEDWKAALRADFERWLAGLDEIPEPEEGRVGSDDAPDLYSFYEQLAAANTETRKANRRTAEVLSQWGDTLASFEKNLGPLRESVARLTVTQPKEGEMSRAHCLALAELLDRVGRIARAFQSTPLKTSWWGGSEAAWRKAWETQRQALDIVVGHLDALLRKEGVSRLDTLGVPFDPTLMTAVAAEPDATRPPQTVIEELAAGYVRRGELLRAAQVKVSRRP